MAKTPLTEWFSKRPPLDSRQEEIKQLRHTLMVRRSWYSAEDFAQAEQRLKELLADES